MIKCAVCVHADVCNGSFNKDATCMYFKPIRLEGHCNFCEETEINKIKKLKGGALRQKSKGPTFRYYLPGHMAYIGF